MDRVITQAMRQPDEKTAENNANDVDHMLWTQWPGIRILQVPSVYAVRSNVANYVGPGVADLNYTAIAFTS